jgi:hypothetical protein
MGRGHGQGAQASAGLRRASVEEEFLPGVTLGEALLSGEIGEFVAPYGRWPSAQEWEDTGQHRLYVKMMRSGGPRRWLSWAHVPYRPTLDDIRRETVRVQLAGFLDEREQWPDEQAFAAAGRERLHALMRKAGGENLWAEIFGFPTQDEREMEALMGITDERDRERQRHRHARRERERARLRR